MAKINYSKAEKVVGEALRKMRARQLAEGKTVTSKRAEEYYGLSDKYPRPVPQDPVEQLLSEEAAKEETEHEIIATPPSDEETADEETPPGLEVSDPFFEMEEETEEADKLVPAKKQSKRVPKKEISEVADVPSSEKFHEPLSPLALLRKHLFWLKRLHVDNRFETIGTTMEEISSLCNTRRLSSEQLDRINELNKRAQTVKEQLLKKTKSETDENLIERQKKAHKNKRFHKKESWLPL